MALCLYGSLSFASGKETTHSYSLYSLNIPTTLDNKLESGSDSGVTVIDVSPDTHSDTVDKESPSDRDPNNGSINHVVPRLRDMNKGDNNSPLTADTPSFREKLADPGKTSDIRLIKPSLWERDADNRDRSEPVEKRGRKSFNMGIQYPGVSLAIRRQSYSLEFKLLHDNDITIYGGRMYHHALLFGTGNLYWAADLSAVDFEGERSSGEGISVGLIGGVEKFFARRLSWKVDLGPYYTFLEDDRTNLDVDGLEFVITTGLTFHFK